MILKCYFDKYTFNEKTNDLEIDRTTKIATKISLKTHAGYREDFFVSLIRTLIYLAIDLFVGWIISTQSLVGGIVFSVLTGGGIIALGVMMCLLDYCPESDELSELYKDVPEYIELQKHNANELERMAVWRENHPFEEKVRKAMQSKNSNDIADVIKSILDRETV